jgi:hypothetical protein
MEKIHSFNNEFIAVFKKIYTDKYGFIDNMNNFHKTLETNALCNGEKKLIKQIKELGKDRTSIFYDDYHNFVDSNNEFNEVYYKFIDKYVKPIYGSKIVVQKTPNLRISFPDSTAIGKHKHENEENNVIGLHKDSDFGHHEEEINYIIPITEMFDTNSIYYEPSQESNASTDQYLNLKLKTNEYFIGKFNKLLHFNKINKTGFTRISLDFRIIPYEKYMTNLDYFKGTKFELGKYYIEI